MLAPRVWSRRLRGPSPWRPAGSQLRPMSIAASQQIWHNGELVPWESANVHILSTAVQFGMSMFEGIRESGRRSVPPLRAPRDTVSPWPDRLAARRAGCYDTPKGPAIVHLDGHLRRLLDSCKIYRIACPYSKEELAAACVEVVQANVRRASRAVPSRTHSLIQN